MLPPRSTPRILHHWPVLDHLEYDQLGVDLPDRSNPNRPWAPLARISLPTGLRTLAAQSVHIDTATELCARLVAASSGTLSHLVLANAHIEPPEELGVLLAPVARTLDTLEYHLVQRTPHALASALLALPNLKHLIVPVDILRTKAVLDALTRKAADPAHAPLESVTLGPEEYHVINKRAPRVMPGKRLRVLEVARVVEVGKVRIGRATAGGLAGVAEVLEGRGVGWEVAEDREVNGEREGRRERWVWH